MTKNVTELYADDFEVFEKELQKNMFEGINKIFDYGVLKGIKSCNLEGKNNISAVELEEIYDSLQKIKSVHIAISQSLYGGKGILRFTKHISFKKIFSFLNSLNK